MQWINFFREIQTLRVFYQNEKLFSPHTPGMCPFLTWFSVAKRVIIALSSSSRPLIISIPHFILIPLFIYFDPAFDPAFYFDPASSLRLRFHSTPSFIHLNTLFTKFHRLTYFLNNLFHFILIFFLKCFWRDSNLDHLTSEASSLPSRRRAIREK